MATTIDKRTSGTQEYTYLVTYQNGSHHWKFLGKAGAVEGSEYVQNGKLTDKGQEAIQNEDIEEDDTHAGRTNAAVVTVNELDEPLRELVDQFGDEAVEDVVDHELLDDDHANYRNILDVVKEVMEENPELEDKIENGEYLVDNIETIQSHYAENGRHLTETAAERVEEAVGDIFEISITEPRNEYQDPMVSLDVDNDAKITENPVLNAAILEKAAYNTRSETRKGQKRKLGDWAEILGGEGKVEGFKESLSDPEALGFTVPTSVPATGDDPGRTPVTDIYGIGSATAEDMHPTGDTLAIEDVPEMTELQSKWIEFPFSELKSSKQDYSSEQPKEIVEAAMREVDDTSKVLGRMLGWMDQRDRDGAFDYVSPANTMGVGSVDDISEYFDDNAPEKPVTEVEKVDSGVWLVNEDGERTMLNDEYYEFAEAAAESKDDMLVGDKTPVVVRNGDGEAVSIAPVRNAPDE